MTHYETVKKNVRMNKYYNTSNISKGVYALSIQSVEKISYDLWFSETTRSTCRKECKTRGIIGRMRPSIRLFRSSLWLWRKPIERQTTRPECRSNILEKSIRNLVPYYSVCISPTHEWRAHQQQCRFFRDTVAQNPCGFP